MPDEEIKPAESSPAATTHAEPSPATTVETPTPVSLTEVLNSATSEERRDWESTGDEQALLDKVEKRRAEGKPKNEPEPAPGTSEEQKKNLTPDERSERDSRRSNKRQREYFQRQVETERTQRIEAERKLAEAKGQKPEPAPGTVQGRPKRPKMTDAKYSGDRGIELYDSDMETYEDSLLSFRDTSRDAVREQATAQVEHEEQIQEDRANWQKNEVSVAKDFPDYVQLKAKIAPKLDHDSPALADAISRLPQGPRLIVYFGKEHPEEWERLCDLPVQEALMELGTIRASLKQAPQPNRETRAPAPVHPVSGRDQVVKSPAEAAFEKGDIATWERLENEKDLREWGLLK